MGNVFLTIFLRIAFGLICVAIFWPIGLPILLVLLWNSVTRWRVWYHKSSDDSAK